MTDRDSVINDLNVAKLILCNPQILTPEMCIRIGQAITSAIALLKKQEAVEPVLDSFLNKRCPSCRTLLNGKFCHECGQEVRWE